MHGIFGAETRRELDRGKRGETQDSRYSLTHKLCYVVSNVQFILLLGVSFRLHTRRENTKGEGEEKN